MPAPEWRLLVERVKRLSVPKGRRELGRFTLEGLRALERALRNGAPLEEVLVSRRLAGAETAREREAVAAVREAGIPLRVAPDAEVDALTGGRGLGDVFGVMRRPDPPDWPDMVRESGRSMVVVGWNLADPGNTGAVIRSALAAGASAFVAVGTTDPWHPKSVRTSMGALFGLPVRREDGDPGLLDPLRRLEFETVGTACRKGTTLPDLRPGPRVALVLGGEAFGLPEEVADRLDRRVTIPMPAGVDSYSVNAAAAVLAYTLMWER